MKKFSAKETLSILNEIENEVDVRNWLVNDIHVWPFVRIHIAHKLNSVKTHESRNDFSKLLPLMNKFLRIFFYRFLDLFHFNRKNVDILFLSYTIYRNIKIDKFRYDSFLFPFMQISKMLGYEYKILEYIGGNNFLGKHYFGTTYIDFQILVNLLKARFHYYRSNLPFDNSYLDSVNTILSRYSCGYVLPKDYILKRVYQISLNSDYFYKVICFYKPKLVLTASYYSWGIPLNIACNRYGIPSIDIQHGLQGNYHPAYNNWINLPKNGYPSLPSYFGVWSHIEVSAIETWTRSTDYKVIEFGNSFTRFLPSNFEDFISYFDNSKIHVLISLQVGRGFPSIYEELIGSSSNSNIFWWIRKHPRMSKDEIDSVISKLDFLHLKNYNFDNASNMNLNILLKYMSYHITEFSTVTLQALAFGVTSFVVDISGMELFENEILSGYVFYNNDSGSILNSILAGKRSSYQPEVISPTVLDERIVMFLKGCVGRN